MDNIQHLLHVGNHPANAEGAARLSRNLRETEEHKHVTNHFIILKKVVNAVMLLLLHFLKKDLHLKYRAANQESRHKNLDQLQIHYPRNVIVRNPEQTSGKEIGGCYKLTIKIRKAMKTHKQGLFLFQITP